MKIKKLLSTVLSLTLAASMFAACGKAPVDNGDNAAAGGDKQQTIKVGIINNDPNESG